MLARALLVLAAAGVAAGAWNEALVRAVGSSGHGWTAVGTRFRSHGDLAAVCGSYLPGDARYVAPQVPDRPSVNVVRTPKKFDARVEWPHCTGMQTVRDQSGCGSCWAMSAAQTFGERLCAQSGQDRFFSAADTVACCDNLTYGCDGGLPWAALEWMSADGEGIVTGGLYGEARGCKPYSFAPCNHFNATKGMSLPACSSIGGRPACERVCRAGYGVPYSEDKFRAGMTYKVPEEVAAIKAALLRGPALATMAVYEDFAVYRGGIYRHAAGDFVGGHSVLLLGWGESDGTAYWRAKNSWNTGWGEGGFFRIAVGECGIESNVVIIDF
eukprot:TRINITY_DN54_c0_g4_i2.p1 TRINITY_DN54_c0_g4~~TRINITY_DN54_c0_g4_i2.p1  ORF type:complete len:327 (+),score=46.18 TRINITY_DN54_c0_g4_i2:63-1043(+)